MMSNGISIHDVGAALEGPILIAQEGMLVPRTGASSRLLHLAHWVIEGFAVREIFVNAYLFPHEVQGKTITLAEVAFLDASGRSYASWRTYRADYNGSWYEEQNDTELVSLLQNELLDKESET